MICITMQRDTQLFCCQRLHHKAVQSYYKKCKEPNFGTFSLPFYPF
jgi:hypothetical protein